MAGVVRSFEIPVLDLERAVGLYEAVFGLRLERAVVDGVEWALFPDDAKGDGASGALALGETYAPSQVGTRVSFAVDDIDETPRRVHALGGATLYPKTSIGDLGHVAEFADSEGNRIALGAP